MEFLSPVGRLVQGGMTLRAKTDMQTGKPKLDDQGQPIMEQFLAIAIPKNSPGLAAFYQVFVAEARAGFPHLFDAQGNCTNPRFAWKIQDGDGVDTNGKSVADKPGFAGHYIFKMASRYAPKCYQAGKYDPAQQIQNPDDVIKCGYYIRVAGQVSGNGVKPSELQAVPGLYVSANLVELVAFGDVIQAGPDASKAFGAAPAGPLPVGAMPTPGGAPAPALPGLQAPSLPAPGALPPSLPAPGALQAPPSGPRYIMAPSALGASREDLHRQGWTDEQLVAHGHMSIG